MAGLRLIMESVGSVEIDGASGVALAIGALPFIGKVLLGALAIIPGYVWIIGGVVLVGGAIVHFGKKAYDSYRESEARAESERWLRTQLESSNLPADSRLRYSEMLARLMNC